jgi:DNA-binding NarL/FixJ family response regulator
MAIRFVIADDFPLLRSGIEHLLATVPDFEVLACCANGREALEAVRRDSPDILILDSSLPVLSSLEVVRILGRERSSTRVVLHAESSEEALMREAVRLGVAGVVLKEMAPEALLQCIRKVQAGQHWLEWRSASGALTDLRRREEGAREIAGVLTPREREILLAVCEGLRNKEVATNFSISEPTVKAHLRHIYEKLHVKGRLALLRYAEGKGMISTIRS